MYMQKVYDVIGIGMGPSNLALAIAIHEHQEDMEALFWRKRTFRLASQYDDSRIRFRVSLPNPEKGNKTKIPIPSYSSMIFSGIN